MQSPLGSTSTVLLTLGLWLLLMMFFYYAYPAWRIWQRHRIPVRQRYAQVSTRSSGAPESTLRTLATASESIVAAGFRSRGLILHVRPSGLATIVAVHDEPSGHTICAALAVFREGKDLSPNALLNFVSEYDNGDRVSTSNAPFNYPLSRDSTVRMVQFPDVTDAGALVTLHRRLLAMGRGEPHPCTLPDDPSYHFGNRIDADWERQIEFGTIRREAGTQYYRMTAFGAALMVWRLRPPSSWVLRWMMRRRARALAAELVPTY